MILLAEPFESLQEGHQICVLARDHQSDKGNFAHEEVSREDFDVLGRIDFYGEIYGVREVELFEVEDNGGVEGPS